MDLSCIAPGIEEDSIFSPAVVPAWPKASNAYRDLFEQAPIGYHEIDTEGTVLRVNATECALLGRARAQVIGKPVWTFLVPEDQAASRERIRQKMCSSEAIPPSERQFVRGDGSIVTLEVRENHILDCEGGIAGIRSTVSDITDRKRAEHAELELRSLEERYRRFFDDDVAGSYISTPEGKLLACNAAFLELFGFESREHAMATSAASTYEAPELRDVFLQKLREARQMRGYETQYRRSDGSRMHAIENVAGSFDANGALVEIRGHIIDDTDRRQKTEALASRTAELARSNSELEQFAYVASHDLQEPLRMVSSYTQLLAKRYRGRLDSDADEFIEYAVDGAHRMRALINDLLEYSRVGRRTAEISNTSSEEAMEAACKNLTIAIEESQTEIEAGALPAVTADPPQLAQLFQNLLGNAIKYRSAAPPRIRVTAEEDAQEWRFAVADNGIGIDPKHSARIFQVFQRLHNRQAYPGTGIGLAICKKIVERHGGRIWLESQPGQGSTFRFTISKQKGSSL